MPFTYGFNTVLGNQNNNPYQAWSNIYSPKPANTGGFGIGQSPSGVPYQALAEAVNKFMADQALNAYKQNLPGYEEMVSKESENTLAQLQGKLPQDVINQVLQQAAQRGISTGSPGSPNFNAAYLANIGKTSIEQMEAGRKGLSEAVTRTPVPELWNPMSLYIPERLAQQELTAAQVPGGHTVRWAPGAFGTPANTYTPLNNMYTGGYSAAQNKPYSYPGLVAGMPKPNYVNGVLTMPNQQQLLGYGNDDPTKVYNKPSTKSAPPLDWLFDYL